MPINARGEMPDAEARRRFVCLIERTIAAINDAPANRPLSLIGSDMVREMEELSTTLGYEYPPFNWRRVGYPSSRTYAEWLQIFLPGSAGGIIDGKRLPGCITRAILLARKNIPSGFDPATDERSPDWHVIYLLSPDDVTFLVGALKQWKMALASNDGPGVRMFQPDDQTKTETDPEWMRVTDAAKLLDLNPGQVSRLVDQSIIAGNGKTGRGRRLERASVVKYRKHLDDQRLP